ncbi:MAG: hypothetical protein GYB67_00650 [Chloroflexi bacterium]|nr:hypothetical protein [Chloroflexota bacterium]
MTNKILTFIKIIRAASGQPLSKRQLGLLLVIVGVVGFTGIIGIDVIDVGREGGIGPAQQIALGGMILLALVGLTLIPLGDTPA